MVELIVGVDLASQPSGTGLAVLAVGADGRLDVRDVRAGADDGDIVEVAAPAAAVGIDAPFGWPAPFVERVASWGRGGRWDGGDGDHVGGGAAPNRALTHRRTDEVARERTGRLPLSVSADRLAYVGFRCARLLDALAAARGLGRQVDRRGADGVVETWPVGTLRCWGLWEKGYQQRSPGAEPIRSALLERLVVTLGLRAGVSERATLVGSPDAFDALVAALGALAAMRGLTCGPGPDDEGLAVIEGWIHLPRRGGALDDLRRDRGTG